MSCSVQPSAGSENWYLAELLFCSECSPGTTILTPKVGTVSTIVLVGEDVWYS